MYRPLFCYNLCTKTVEMLTLLLFVYSWRQFTRTTLVTKDVQDKIQAVFRCQPLTDIHPCSKDNVGALV